MRLHTNLEQRDIYVAVLFDGIIDYRIRAELGLSYLGMPVHSLRRTFVNNWANFSNSGAFLGWEYDSASVGYKNAISESGFPTWREQVLDEYETDMDREGARDALQFESASFNGTFKSRRIVTCYPFRLNSVADTLTFSFKEKSVFATMPKPSVEVFIACRSMNG